MNQRSFESERATTDPDGSESRFRRWMEMSPAGIYRSSLDGVILECNLAFARIFGYSSADEVAGLDTRDLFWDVRDRDRLVEELMRDGAVLRAEISCRRRDGQQIRLLGAGR
ncbi:MAG: PAS domain S-box protein, partial [Thermoanaerobaculia bacterium]|nr:PAS domain S-box protein [Thermoanaerobaculia bacterium]